MNYGYMEGEDQRLEITKFAKDHNLEIDNWLEIQPGNWNQATLEELLKSIQKDDVILCYELSQVGMEFALNFLSLCLKKGVKIWAVKDNHIVGEEFAPIIDSVVKFFINAKR